MVCAVDFANLTVNKSTSLQKVIDQLKEAKGLNKPGINVLDGENSETLYISGPPVLEEQHHYKLEMSLEQLQA